jgi:hypothetical protein
LYWNTTFHSINFSITEAGNFTRQNADWGSGFLAACPSDEIGAEFVTMRAFNLLTLCLLLLFATIAQAQSCNPATVSLIVHDETGAILTESDLKMLAAALPESIGDAGVSVAEVSLAPDEKSFYWDESTDFQKGRKVPALLFSNAATCTMNLGDVVLLFHRRKMRLRFNIEIDRSTKDRRPVVQSPKFEHGVFELDLKDWSHDKNGIIPSNRWKRHS